MNDLTLSRYLAIFAIIVSTLFIAVGFWLVDIYVGIWFAIGVGLVWLALQQLPQSWPGNFGFALCFLLAALGSFLDVNPLLLALSVISGLAAWDLGHFTKRLKDIPQHPDAPGLEMVHLKRLGQVALVSITLILVALSIQLELSFLGALALALLLVLGLGQTLSYLRKQNE
ncbi:MAG: hypothetical protein DWQ07_22960 [Chloroflexi bacterium]|nr:MAG: hypothetical protein DWQ07_22960 [Chloroflexota bacterium]MBL1194009.1 hypothetical protein [Chloroflexota bacterium]NOH11303.1 hypothetical protein [Chloroflexota bacterium]